MIKTVIQSVLRYGKDGLSALGGAEPVCLALLGTVVVGFILTVLTLSLKKAPSLSADLAFAMQKNLSIERRFANFCRLIATLTLAIAGLDALGERAVFVDLSVTAAYFALFTVICLLLRGVLLAVSRAANKKMRFSYKIARLAEERRLSAIKQGIRAAQREGSPCEEPPVRSCFSPALEKNGEEKAIEPSWKGRTSQGGSAADRAEEPTGKRGGLGDTGVRFTPSTPLKNSPVCPVEEPNSAPAVKEPDFPRAPQTVCPPTDPSEETNAAALPLFDKAQTADAEPVAPVLTNGISRGKVEELLKRASLLPLSEADALHARKLELGIRDALSEGCPAESLSSLLSALVKMIAKYDAA